MASGNSRWSERELIRNISEIFAVANSGVIVGIGDDAAVLAPSDQKLVVTTDMFVEGVHFRKDWSNAKEIGRKATIANLADIYAMSGRPKFITVAMSATGEEELEWMLDVARGIAEEAKKVGAEVIGGDLSRSDAITISITVIGECDAPILRNGAQIGDQIYISDLTGWSAAGLLALQSDRKESSFAEVISRHKVPLFDGKAAEIFSKGANSLCDISDSLLIQAEQMAEASGVCFEIDAHHFEKHPDFARFSQIANELGVSTFELILSGGEDHVLMMTSSSSPPLNALRIGQVQRGSGIKLLHVDTPQAGWQHFK